MVSKQDLATLVASLGIMLVPAVVFLLLHPAGSIPIHFSQAPDKFIPAEYFPAFLIGMWGLVVALWGIRFIYPWEERIRKFSSLYNLFVLAFSLFLAVILSMSVIWASGVNIPLSNIVAGCVGGILLFAGVVMYFSERNWVIGFRNPWTLTSDFVWERVNRVAGILTACAGMSMIVLALLGGNYMPVLWILIVGYILLFGYSYLLWRQEREWAKR